MATRYAQIIVDVPTMQTNRPYTYALPADLQGQVQPGMRVIVPFGHRQVMGFVVALTDKSDVAAEELKEVTTSLDLEPVLSPELVQLSAELAEDIFAFRITILQSMLPNSLKADYQQRLKLEKADLSDDIRVEYLEGQQERDVKLSKFTPKQWRQLKQLAAEGWLSIEPIIANRGRIKKQRAYQLSADSEFLEEAAGQLRANAKQQKHLLDFILENQGQTFTKKELQEMADFSTATLQAGVKKGWLQATDVELLRRPAGTAIESGQQWHQLNPEQEAAYEAVIGAAHAQTYQPFLLEGITGSGKTEVYLQAAAEVLKSGKTVLFLVPEIALTPQMLERVRARFGNKTAVLHSGLSEGERYDEWRRTERGDVQVVVGARSAVFAPLTNLGLIIVDEEHETSYQQADNPRYNARDVALWRAAYHDIPVILGSATPSLESRSRAQKGVYQHLMLTKRAGGAELPKVEIVDMKESMADQPDTNFSTSLRNKIQARLDRKEQMVLLLNRRGYSSFVMCRDCGFVPRDPNCNLAMTLHMDTHTLKCHYCGYQEPIPQICPACGSKRIRYYGTGTQKAEAELMDLFPSARVIRIDQDTTRKKGSLAKALQRFGQGEADILLGTQMVAKGLDFPDVTLVGVLNADTSLGLPDFHAAERTFQLLTQVAGRAGRHEAKGEVVIQTFNPEHYAITYAQKHDYEGFYRQEMAIRHAGQYPPYFYTVQIQMSAPEENQVALQAAQVGRWLKKRIPNNVIQLGPSPQPIAKLKNRYYFQILLKLKDDHEMDGFLHELADRAQKAKNGLQLNVIRNPLSFM
ncbi:primosomal protein N' [Eupransor demetentiae]|uniref:Replication restart protein PriA n=1 Tax=Eupransor demetentiae TaxID=3109584 RepID=A0ABP0ESM5_9LACO|nr:Primosomal protein N' (replication factor Y) -superfamily II helicase (PriA) [Lactobacillaceae bacterium LMG 33000]